MDIFETTRIKLSNQGLRIDRYDLNRPWGGFFVLDENQAQAFADIYFEGLDVGPLRIAGKLSPKILLVSRGAFELAVSSETCRNLACSGRSCGYCAQCDG